MLLAQPPSAAAGPPCARSPAPYAPTRRQPQACRHTVGTRECLRASVTVRAVAGGLQIDRNDGFMPKPCLTMSSYARLLSREDRSAARALLLQA